MTDGATMMFVYTIVERPGMEKPFWIKVGVAFTNRDDSLNVYLDALPINGKLHIRERPPEQDRDR